VSVVWPELYFIRHGQTDWNAEGRYQGAKDIPLNAIGRGQADLNGRLLADLFRRSGRAPDEFSWRASPLSRTRETMERVRGAFDAGLPEVAFDQRLVEISFGIYEGRLLAELASGEMAVAGDRDADFWFYRPPEGESYQDLSERIEAFGEGLAGPTVIVSHGGILRVRRHLIEGFPIDSAVNWFPPQDAVMHFRDGRSVVYPAG
jgi:probable phosphoglycerate mutase